MSSDWIGGKLGDFVELKRGYDLPQAKRTLGGVPLVSSSGVTDRHDVAMVRGPGVVTGRYGTIGKVFYVEEDFWPLNTTLYVRDFKGNHRKFINYFLKTLDFHAYSDKAAVPGVNRNHLHEALVSIPPVSAQVKIADFLGALDDRITLLRETNTTLEAIAQALFKSWFVNFDPVHAKMQGRAPEGMDEATAALFPDSFEESELGPVPKGWVVCKLAEIASLKGGKMLDKASFLENGEHPVFGGAGVMGYSNLSNAEGFVITVGRVGAYCGQYFWHQGKAWVNNNASLVSPLNPDHSCWLFLWLKSVDMELIKKGAAQPFVSNGDISVLKIVLPPNQAIEKFIESADPIFQRLSSITTQIKSLESLRETLLPRLISGQLRVNEATEAIQ
jgi:type I restriction enzyme S subunit